MESDDNPDNVPNRIMEYLTKSPRTHANLFHSPDKHITEESVLDKFLKYMTQDGLLKVPR